MVESGLLRLIEIRRVIGIIFAVSFVLAATCPTVLISPPTPHGQYLVWEVEYLPSSLDPHTAIFECERWIISNIYETLLVDTFLGSTTVGFEGRLAKSWEVSSDELTYTFQLREGVEFHDGTPFNTSCVQYNLERIVSLEGLYKDWTLTPIIKGGQAIIDAAEGYGYSSTQYQGNYTEWKIHSNSIVILDDCSVRIELARPFAPFLSILAATTSSIICPTYLEHYGGTSIEESTTWMRTHCCGTGPYTLETYTSEASNELTSFQNYWNWAFLKVTYPYAGAISNIELREEYQGATRIQNLIDGETDVCAWPKKDASIVRNNYSGDSRDGTLKSSDPNLKVWADEPTYSIHGIGLNCKEFYWPSSNESILMNPLHLVEFRRALVYSFNYSAYIEQALYGYGKYIVEPIPEGLPGHNSSYSVGIFNISKAVTSWNEAMEKGLDSILENNSYMLSFFCLAVNQGDAIACELICDGLREIISSPTAIPPASDLEIDYIQQEWVVPSTNVSHLNYFLNLFPSYADPHEYVSYLFVSTGVPASRSGVSQIPEWNSTQVEVMIQLASESQDSIGRETSYIQIQDYAFKHLPYIWIAQETNLQVMREDVYSYIFNPLGETPLYPLYKLNMGTDYFGFLAYRVFCFSTVTIAIISFVGVVLITMWIKIKERKIVSPISPNTSFE